MFTKQITKSRQRSSVNQITAEVLSRTIEHGAAECLTMCGIFNGCDPSTFESPPKSYSERGLMLVEVEFLLRHTERCPHSICVYPRSPQYLEQIASLFPGVRFFAFSAQESDEYDPESRQPRPNVLTFPFQLTQDIASIIAAMRLGWTLLLLCHPDDPPKEQLSMHVRLNPNHTLFAVTAAAIPEEFSSGVLVLPVHPPFNSFLVHIDSPCQACSRVYFPFHLRDELAYHHVMTRCGGKYDQECETFIARSYSMTWQTPALGAEKLLSALPPLN